MNDKLTYFFTKIKDVNVYDFIAIVPCVLAKFVSFFIKKKHKNLWLICEEENEARDNGYWFFKYMCENHPDYEVVYAINKKSADYDKVKNIGKVIQYGSFKHWLYYFCATKNISSQKGGKPNAALCFLLEISALIKNDRIFLQHGIIINDTKWLYYEKTKFSKFICSIDPEYRYIKDHFHYPKGILECTGLARFDNLHKFNVKKNQIIIMPTWRSWFKLKSKNDGTIEVDFGKSSYYFYWKSFLCSDKLQQLIKKYDLNICFYPHRNMQNYLSLFTDVPKNIQLLGWQKRDIQEVLKTSALMITDYSSVFFDFVYMKKPVIFYQFDKDDFRKHQYEEGWFSYEDNDISLYANKEIDLINHLERMAENKFQVDEIFLNTHSTLFKKFDTNNCQRIYEVIKDNP